MRATRPAGSVTSLAEGLNQTTNQGSCPTDNTPACDPRSPRPITRKNPLANVENEFDIYGMKLLRKTILWILSMILGAMIGCTADVHVTRPGDQLDAHFHLNGGTPNVAE
jgi:hypothetical protein